MIPAWHAWAACRSHPDPDLWFPGPGNNRRRQKAVQICAGCPVRARCSDWADRNRPLEGIWGGRTASGVGAMPEPRNHRPQADLRPCGTVAAYARHLRHGQAPCQDCCDARSNYYADARRRKRAKNSECKQRGLSQ